jgi:hypothetical protein
LKLAKHVGSAEQLAEGALICVNVTGPVKDPVNSTVPLAIAPLVAVVKPELLVMVTKPPGPNTVPSPIDVLPMNATGAPVAKLTVPKFTPAGNVPLNGATPKLGGAIVPGREPTVCDT